MLCEFLGADRARESNQIPRHSEAKEPGPPIPERIVPAVGLERAPRAPITRATFSAAISKQPLTATANR